MYCGKCGKKLSENSKFCGYCGNEISHLESMPQTIKKKTKDIKKTCKSIIVCLVLFVVLIMIIVLRYKSYIAGPHIDKNLVETFPFQSGSMSDVENWLTRNRDYKIKEIDQRNGQIEILYKSNDAWRIVACNKVYGVEGFYVDLCFSLEVLNIIGIEQVYEIVFETVVTDLKYICGSPTDIRVNGEVYEFYYKGLTIVVSVHSDGVWVWMNHKK